MRIIYLICISMLLITGCSSNTTKSINSNNEQAQSKKELDRYIQLFNSKDYETLKKETVDLKNDNQKDFYFLASAFEVKKEASIKSYSKIEDMGSDYAQIYDYLIKVKSVPETLQGDVDRLKKLAYGKKISSSSKYQIDQATLNPHQVEIGMTQEEVLTKGWGRPQKINSTKTAESFSEQWVYRNYNYLYFENGILTSISN